MVPRTAFRFDARAGAVGRTPPPHGADSMQGPRSDRGRFVGDVGGVGRGDSVRTQQQWPLQTASHLQRWCDGDAGSADADRTAAAEAEDPAASAQTTTAISRRASPRRRSVRWRDRIARTLWRETPGLVPWESGRS